MREAERLAAWVISPLDLPLHSSAAPVTMMASGRQCLKCCSARAIRSAALVPGEKAETWRSVTWSSRVGASVVDAPYPCRIVPSNSGEGRPLALWRINVSISEAKTRNAINGQPES